MVALRSWDYIYARHRRSHLGYNKREYASAVAAASQFLGRAPNLEHFCFRHVSVYNFTSFVRFMEGGAGARLRSLWLPGMGSCAQMDFVESVLKAGRLPLLETLELDALGHSSLGGLDWAGAWEERGRLGLPSVTCIKGLCNLTEAAGLRRVWACCPPDRITHLDARNQVQLMALGEFLLGHPKFVALRSVYLEGESQSTGACEYMPPDMAGICLALGQGHAPAIEELKVNDWGLGILRALVPIIGKGKLPRLTSLKFSCEGYEGIHELFESLRALPHVRLKRLQIGGYGMDENAGRSLIETLKFGGALSELEELEIPVVQVEFDGLIVGALAAGAPCSRTLRALRLHCAKTDKTHTGAFLAAMGCGAFPSLTTLKLAGEWMDSVAVGELGKALLDQAGTGAPSHLRELWLGGVANNPLSWLDELTPAFAADALPFLTHLRLGGGNDLNDAMPPPFLKGWTALGRKVKLEVLEFFCGSVSMDNEQRIVAAFEDPDFLPFLRRTVCEGAPDLLEGVAGKLDVRFGVRNGMGVTVEEDEGTIVYCGVYDEGLKQFNVKRVRAPENA